MNTIAMQSKRTAIATAIASTIGMSASLYAVAEERSSAFAIMEEVQVFGTKRSTSQAAQDVPNQVAAYGSDQLAARQVVTVEDLAFSIPNVNLGSVGTSPGVASFFIRGQGVASSIPSIDPSVGVFVDGVYQGVTFGVITDTFDLESIEIYKGPQGVLFGAHIAAKQYALRTLIEIYKGPQGVLFGRNVSAGAVLLRSARPDGEFGVKAKVGMESGDEKDQYTAAFSVQGSLMEDTLAGKLSVYYKDDGGYFKNTSLGGAAGEDRTQTARGTLVYTPDDDTELTLIYEYGDQHGDGPVTLEQSKVGLGVTTPHHGDSHSTEQNFNGLSDNEWNQVTFEAAFDVGKGRLTNILAYRDIDSLSEADVDSSAGSFQLHTLGNIYQDQWSNELRYNIMPTDEWDLTVGAYIFEQEFRYDVQLDRGVGSTQIKGRGIQDQQTLGVFINNEYAMTDTLSLSAGVRYTEEEKDVTIWARTSVAGGGCEFNGDCPPKEGVGDEWSNTAPKLGLQWHITEDAQLYTHWSRAYRSGMYNMRTPLADEPKPTDVEETNSYELGLKSTWLDGTLRLNAAVFQNQITDMVIESLGQQADGSPLQDFQNAGDATINGLEIDVMWMLSDNLVISAGVGLLDAEYDSVSVNLDGSDTDGDGNKDTFSLPADEKLDLKYIPETTYTLGINYELAIGNYGSLSSRLDYSYRSETMYKDDNTAEFPSYEQVNAAFTYRPTEGDWSVQLYAKNLTDETVVGGVSPFGPIIFSPMKKGRRIGAEFTYEF